MLMPCHSRMRRAVGGAGATLGAAKAISELKPEGVEVG